MLTKNKGVGYPTPKTLITFCKICQTGSPVDTLELHFSYEDKVWIDSIEATDTAEEPFIYDDNGNPISMEDLNFHWTNGRNLSSITYTDDNNEVATLISFKYDDNGIRVSKTYGDTTIYYTTINGTITSQYELDENDNPINVIEFIYDSNDEIIGFTYNYNTYFYIKNIQGDITNIVDNTGNVIVNYYYDAWGVPYSEDLSNNNLAEINPMRYRGYYYDCEMGLYYLQSRYYIPTFCRFLNSDLPEYAQMQRDDYAGTNLFAYCCNDAVNNSDPMGYWGADIHYGRNHKKGGPYDGTYEWAIKSGFREEYAKKIAKGDNSVDTDKKTTPTPIKGEKGNDLAKRQRFHFNRNPKGKTDSRKVEGDAFIEEAINEFNIANNSYTSKLKKLKKKYPLFSKEYKDEKNKLDKARNEHFLLACYILGKGLHCYQDIDAHGNINDGKADGIFYYRRLGHIIPTKAVVGADNPFYDWKNSQKNNVGKKQKKLTKRYYNTRLNTRLILIIFLSETNYNSVVYSKNDDVWDKTYK